VRPLGPKLAEGRDSEIFEHGPGRVLRLARDGRSLEGEASVMRYARDRGFPVPAVHDAGDGYLVMDRLVGPTMLDALVRRPWRMGWGGRTLADLHRRLHELPAPAGVPSVEPAGDRLLHRDLHPLNVILTRSGPVVIDWANAARGDPAYDVADTWVVLSVADAPGGALVRKAVGLGRSMFLRRFLEGADMDRVVAAVPFVARNRLTDRNMSHEEQSRIRDMEDRLARGG